jgi:protein phosphatase
MAVGVAATVTVRYYAVQMKPDAVIMLSSDGLHGVITDAQIEGILQAGTALEDTCHNLIAAANEAGSPDNVTVLLIRRRR